MSWAEQLYKAYDVHAAEIGEFTSHGVPLLPIYHTTFRADVEVVVNRDGDFLSATVLDDSNCVMILPGTAASIARTSNPEPYPLFDRIQYLAGDYSDFVPSKNFFYDEYMDILEEWQKSEYTHPVLEPIYTYLNKGLLLHDLISAGVLFAENGRLLTKWSGDKKSKPPIFDKVLGTGVEKTFVRIRVDGCVAPWEDKSLWEKWIAHEDAIRDDVDLCYVTGKMLQRSGPCPQKIRHQADKSRIITSSGSSGFTYRGRFLFAEEAACIGRETADKIHNILRWLLSRDGYMYESLSMLVWSNTVDFPSRFLELSSYDLALSLCKITGCEARGDNPALSALMDFRATLKDSDQVNVLVLDSPVLARLSITYYREMRAVDLVDRVYTWHDTCCATQALIHADYDEPEDATMGKTTFFGAPSLKAILDVICGPGSVLEARRPYIMQLLSYIVDGRKVTDDFLRQVSKADDLPPPLKNYARLFKSGVIQALLGKYSSDNLRNHY